MNKKHQQKPCALGLIFAIFCTLILLITALPTHAFGHHRCQPCNAKQSLEDRKEALISTYNAVKGKFFQQRDLLDCLAEPIIGSDDWRYNLNFVEQVGEYDAVVCREYNVYIPDITPKMFDWWWNRLDFTAYSAWSVFHQGWEWLKPPDSNGTGAFKVAWQQPPGRPFGATFASWDSAEPYIAFPLEYDYALLMRFWFYDPAQKQFALVGRGFLLEWEAAPGGGVNLKVKALGLGAPGCEEFEEGDFSVDNPHVWEEINSWHMGLMELARRKNFTSSLYTPVFKVGDEKKCRKKWKNKCKPKQDPDPGNVKIYTDDELWEMKTPDIERGYDALWQKYLGQKSSADYLLHYYADHPEYDRPDCSLIRDNWFIPQP